MATYTFIQSATAPSGNVATFNFTSIPQTYQDLVIICNTRNDANDYGGFFITPNGSTFGTNVTAKRFGVYGTTNNYSTSTEVVWNIDNATSYFGNGRIYIANYASTTSNKSALLMAGQTGTGTDLVHHFSAWRWAQTAAITSLQLGTDSGTNIFKRYSSAYLYGISKS